MTQPQSPIQRLLKLYVDLGPYQSHANGAKREIVCASCGDGYRIPSPGRLHGGIRHMRNCRVRETKRALHAAGYALPHVHAETLAAR